MSMILTPRVLRRVRLLTLGDRNPDFLTHREIASALQLPPAGIDCRWVATDDPVKLGCANRTQAGLLAHDAGIVR
jgi:hypothetical protein